MRGLHLDRGRLSLRGDLPEPSPRPDWTVVAVRRAGICATDQALVRGYMDFVGTPGHEFVGVALDGPLRGRRVVGEINAGCGECAECRRGDARHCASRSVLGIFGHQGAFAERLALPTRNLLAVPDAVSDDEATFVEPLAAALHIADDIEVGPGVRCLVAGDGKLGLLCAMALAARGAEVTVAGRHAERAALLPPSVAYRIGMLESQPAGPIDRFDVVVEATGNPDVLARLPALVRPRGTIVLKTTTERPVAIDLAPLVVDEIRLVGSRCGRFEPALQALAERRAAVAGLVAARYSLADAESAFAHAARRGVLKVLLEP
jgi:threonine dehydrogenase-like Zn-dependent dehydrogenase